MCPKLADYSESQPLFKQLGSLNFRSRMQENEAELNPVFAEKLFGQHFAHEELAFG